MSHASQTVLRESSGTIIVSVVETTLRPSTIVSWSWANFLH